MPHAALGNFLADALDLALTSGSPDSGIFIELMNSALFLVFAIRSMINSICSTPDSALSARRSSQTRLKSFFGTSNSSLRVPDFCRSMAGKTRLSERRRSRWISRLPVPLNS